MASRDPAWIWTSYWRGGRQECCAALDFARFWRAFFSEFPACARLLDLATGAGQVALHAAAAGSFDIEGVDIAEIAAPKNSPVRLTGGVALEDLPFDDETFDGIASQFGIEYARGGALDEAMRVLKPGGRGLFVVHHAGGAIFSATAARLATYDAVIGKGESFAAAMRLFALYRARAAVANVQAAQTELRGLVQAMQGRLGPQPDENVAGIVSFMADLARDAARYDPADALARIRDARMEVKGWRLRQMAQQRAARSEAGMAAMAARLEAAGATTDAPEILRGSGGEIVAWALRFRKREHL